MISRRGSSGVKYHRVSERAKMASNRRANQNKIKHRNICAQTGIEEAVKHENQQRRSVKRRRISKATASAA